MKKESKLGVFAYLDGWAPSGILTMLEENTHVLSSAFSYGSIYIDKSNAIEIDPVSLSLSDKAQIKHKALIPAGNLAYFGGIRDAAPDSWGRRVIESKLKAPSNSLNESTYLIHAGSNRVGALDIRPSIKELATSSKTKWANLQYLMDAAERIDEGEPIPASLEIIYENGTALGGGRPKASIEDEVGVLHLAKFSSANDKYSIPEIEMATLKLASICGLTVPAVRVVQLGERKVMMIRRFDRYFSKDNETLNMSKMLESMPGTGYTEKRLPFVSGLTLLNCDETESPTKSYADLASAIRRFCHPSVIKDDQRELFGRMVYNILVSNDDDHLRNHGFILDPNLKGWRLSPLYDVMPRPTLAYERNLHLSVGGLGRSATIDNALTSHTLFDLSLDTAEEIIDRIYTHVREWKVYFEEFGVEKKDIQMIDSAFRKMDEVRTNNVTSGPGNRRRM